MLSVADYHVNSHCDHDLHGNHHAHRLEEQQHEQIVGARAQNPDQSHQVCSLQEQIQKWQLETNNNGGREPLTVSVTCRPKYDFAAISLTPVDLCLAKIGICL